jgi:hypothetical protein
VTFGGRPWRVQDFDISMVCGIELKLCHNLPLRGFGQRIRYAPSASGGALKNLSRGEELAPEDRY